MKVNEKQLQAVIALPGSERYKRFIKIVADWQEVWGLYCNGWALAATDEGTKTFPVWPAKEYAEICAHEEWKGYEPRRIKIDEFMGVVLPRLKNDGVLPAVFVTPTSKGVTPPVDELLAALEAELQRF